MNRELLRSVDSRCPLWRWKQLTWPRASEGGQNSGQYNVFMLDVTASQAQKRLKYLFSTEVILPSRWKNQQTQAYIISLT